MLESAQPQRMARWPGINAAPAARAGSPGCGDGYDESWMQMKLGSGEPAAGPWQVMAVDAFAALVVEVEGRPPRRPWVLAVDGRSGSGKSTLAALLQRAVPASAVVHTDDVAWHHSFFDWEALLVEGILKPVHAGESVRYQPPGWCAQGRPGAIELPAGLALLIVEGVGASRTEAMPWIDCAVWVQSDLDAAERRGIARDGGSEEAVRFWHEWMAAEVAFLARQRPWDRARLIVSGSPQLPHNRETELVVAPALQKTTLPRTNL